MSPAQSARMASIFPGGVCDWTQPGVGEQPLGGTWQTFAAGTASDTTPPDTSISTSPATSVTLGPVRFGFSGNEMGVSFECNLDGSAFSACASPSRFDGLGQGSHTFRVRAIDPAGNADQTPASSTFTITNALPPTVAFVSPTDGATQAPRTSPVVAGFDRAMDKPATEAAFSLKRNSDGATVSGSFGWYGNALIFQPAKPLSSGTTYTASVGASAEDANGIALGTAKTWQFTTATQPLIAAVVPAENATEVLPNATFVVAFDSSMDKPSAQAAFSLKRAVDNAPVSGSFGWFGNALLFQPGTRLDGGTQYVATVSTAAKDASGHPLPAAKSWKLTTTARPIADILYPSDGANGVSRSSITLATFNKPMDEPSTEAAFSLKRSSNGAPVSGGISWWGNILIFMPASPLAANTQYTAAIGAGARDLAGRALANPTSWRYTTGG